MNRNPERWTLEQLFDAVIDPNSIDIELFPDVAKELVRRGRFLLEDDPGKVEASEGGEVAADPNDLPRRQVEALERIADQLCYVWQELQRIGGGS